MSSARDVVVKLLYTAGLSSAFSCWWYRPAVDRLNGQGTRRSGSMSAIDYHDTYCRPYPLPLQLGAYFSTALVACACRSFIYGMGNFQVKEDEHYWNFVKRTQNRDPRVPMITLPNHRSTMDDPMVLASLLPFWMSVQPQFLRWAVCAQEICFCEENIVTAFFGLGGKTLPMCRGEGIDQPLLLQLARKGVPSCGAGADSGCQTSGRAERSAGWINIHSEAGVFQKHHSLGGRGGERGEALGCLKWGAAKLIVHSPSYDLAGTGTGTGAGSAGPVVIPFYMTGMDSVMPLEKRRLPVPVPGHRVKVRFGSELRFDDLISEYEAEAGHKLRRYHCCGDPRCQEKRTDAEAISLNVWLSGALMACMERVSGAAGDAFWNLAAGWGLAEPRPRRALPCSSQAAVCSAGLRSAAPPDLMFDLDSWVSTEAEKKLYHRVMLRIQAAMQQLCDDDAAEDEDGAALALSMQTQTQTQTQTQAQENSNSTPRASSS